MGDRIKAQNTSATQLEGNIINIDALCQSLPKFLSESNLINRGLFLLFQASSIKRVHIVHRQQVYLFLKKANITILYCIDQQKPLHSHRSSNFNRLSC